MKFRIKQVRVAELMSAYKPDEVGGFCAACGNHGQVWSCPPHGFDPAKFLKGFKFASVIVGEISLVGFETQEESIAFYYERRRIVNERVLACEMQYPESKALYAGHCEQCSPCTRAEGQPCVLPEKRRYSLEALGLKVSDILEVYFDETMQWADKKQPEQLLVVPALLTLCEIDAAKLLDALSTS